MIDREKMRVGEAKSRRRGTGGDRLRELGPDVLSCD